MVLFKFKMAKNNLVKNNKSYKSLEILQDEAVKSKISITFSQHYSLHTCNISRNDSLISYDIKH